MSRRDFTRVEEYAACAEALVHSDALLPTVRSRAVEALRATGFPARDEAWKYTRASLLLGETFSVADGAAAVSLPSGPWGDEPRLVFVDGLVQPSASTMDAARISTLEPEWADVDGFAALNLALLRGGAELELTAGRVHLVHVSTGGGRLGAVRHRVVVPSQVEAEVIEHFVTVGEGTGFTTAFTDVRVQEGASLHHVRVLDEGPEGLHHGVTTAEVEDAARYDFTSVVLGGRVARVEATVRLAGRGAATALRGLSLLRGVQHADHHVTVDHAVPHATSDQVFRSVLDGRSRSVYTGAVIVREGAVGTDSNQLHNALLLSDDAVANTRPWLQIDNDDVVCAHGAAIGNLDEEALFYLRQRGLSSVEARALLTWGFATETLAAMAPGPTRDTLQERARDWLGAA